MLIKKRKPVSVMHAGGGWGVNLEKKKRFKVNCMTLFTR